MPGFTDTTIVVEVGLKREPVTSWTKGYAAANGPVARPEYALRELLAGLVQQLCNVHNKVKSTANPGEALLALTKTSGFNSRTALSSVNHFAVELAAFFSAGGGGFEDAKREMAQELALKANRLWMRGKGGEVMKNCQPLGCFIGGDLTHEADTGAILGPGGNFNCKSSERCGAAQYMHSHHIEVQRLIDALHPDSLDEAARGKTENSSRRTALKELLNRGPAAFNKNRCRALGDAYFAVMAPPGHEVMTTNVVDHEPLCNALGKLVARPK